MRTLDLQHLSSALLPKAVIPARHACPRPPKLRKLAKIKGAARRDCLIAFDISYCRASENGPLLLCRLIWQARQTPAINKGLRSTHAPKGRVRHQFTDPPIWITRKKKTGFLPCLRHAAGKGKRSNQVLP